MSTFRQKVQATTNWVKPDPEDLVEAPRPSRRARKRPGAPVTAHRLFPAFATMWFAALFGLGSLAVPSNLLGALVMATGLPALVPAAAPPLGFTAHLLVAFMLTGFGAAVGLALALRLSPRGTAEARPVETAAPAAQPEAEDEDVYKVRARDAHPDAPPRRPLVLTEAFVDPLIAETEPAEQPLLRKRALFVGEPVGEADIWIPEFTPGEVDVVRPLDLSALDLKTALVEPLKEPASAEIELASQSEPEPAPEPAPEPEFETMDTLHTLAEPEMVVQPAAVPAPPALIAATPQLPASFAAALPDVSDGTWSPVAGAPLESLGLVQLIERLALAIAAQKASKAAIVGAEPAATALPEAEVLSAEPEVALQPEPQPVLELEPEFAPGPFSQPQIASIALDDTPAKDVPAVGSAREAILRRLGTIAAGDLAETPGSTAAAAPSFSRPAPVSNETPADAVVSLRPSAPPFAPPAVTSSSATAAPLETEAALRSALATLQRMTARG